MTLKKAGIVAAGFPCINGTDGDKVGEGYGFCALSG